MNLYICINVHIYECTHMLQGCGLPDNSLMFMHRALLFKQERTSDEAFFYILFGKSDLQKMIIHFTL